MVHGFQAVFVSDTSILHCEAGFPKFISRNSQDSSTATHRPRTPRSKIYWFSRGLRFSWDESGAMLDAIYVIRVGA